MKFKVFGNVFFNPFTKADKEKARFFGGPIMAEVIGLGFYILELCTWGDWLDFYSVTYEGVIRP